MCAGCKLYRGRSFQFHLACAVAAPQVPKQRAAGPCLEPAWLVQRPGVRRLFIGSGRVVCKHTFPRSLLRGSRPRHSGNQDAVPHDLAETLCPRVLGRCLPLSPGARDSLPHARQNIGDRPPGRAPAEHAECAAQASRRDPEGVPLRCCRSFALWFNRHIS